LDFPLTVIDGCAGGKKIDGWLRFNRPSELLQYRLVVFLQQLGFKLNVVVDQLRHVARDVFDGVAE
jgi:hypothetical protein